MAAVVIQNQDMDECSMQMHQCHKDAHCINAINGYECQCNDCYLGDGHKRVEWGRRLLDIPDHVRGFVHMYDGVTLPLFANPSYIEDIRQLQVRNTDTFVITYPRSGTTWTLHLVLQIKGKRYLDDTTLFESYNFLERPQDDLDLSTDGFYKFADIMPAPRVFKTHFQFRHLPEDLLRTGAKIVYVARNPKDVAVSWYHFSIMKKFFPSYASWDEFFDQFCKGLVPYGDWFDHVRSAWKLRDHPNLLFIKYEDMVKDLETTVRTLSEFLGKALTEGEVEQICDNSIFPKMRDNDKVNPDSYFTKVKKSEGRHIKFMRKGVVGDWKNLFTAAQSERFDDIYKTRMKDTGLEFTFE